MGGQTHLGSIIEAWINVAVGFGINWLANMTLLPMFGFHIHASEAFHLGLIFTVISVIRSYALRRVFNKIRSLHHAPAH